MIAHHAVPKLGKMNVQDIKHDTSPPSWRRSRSGRVQPTAGEGWPSVATAALAYSAHPRLQRGARLP